MTTIHAAPSMMLRPTVTPQQKGLPVMKLASASQPSPNIQGLPVMKVSPISTTSPNANGLPVMQTDPGAPNVSPNANGVPVMKVGLANTGPTVNGLPIMQVDPTSQTKSGTVQSSANGAGSFSETIAMVDGHKTTDKTIDYADGKTVSEERTVTLNPDGSKTITVTNAKGKTKTIDESSSRNSDGSFSIHKEVTKANGDVTTVSGTVMRSHGETDKTLVKTNADGETETLNATSSRTGNIAMHHRSGTGYNGQAIDKSSTWTTYA